MYNIINLNNEYQLYIKKGATALFSNSELISQIETFKGYECYNIGTFPAMQSFYINPINLESDYINSIAFIIKKDLLKSLNYKLNKFIGNEINLELSAILKARKIKIKCLYNIKVQYNFIDNSKTYSQNKKECLFLEYKYINKTLALKNYLSTIKSPKPYPNVRKDLLKGFFDFLLSMPLIKTASLLNIDNNYINIGSFTQNKLSSHPKVSILIRTYKKKESLRNTLNSLCHQDYDNFEIIIVEDGSNTAQTMIENDFSNMPISYYCPNKSLGRTAIANIALKKATGDYICFLDDDDFYYPDYIKSNIQLFLENETKDFVFSSFVSLNADILSLEPYNIDIKSVQSNIFSHITLMDMCVKCRVPITGVMFKRDLFLNFGGMDENLDADEDWHLWLKYISKTNNKNILMQADIKRCISACVYPANENLAKERHDKYSVYDEIMLKDKTLTFKVSDEEIDLWKKTVKSDVLHLFNNGLLNDFLKNTKSLGEKDLDTSKSEFTAFEINNYYYFLLNKYSNELL